jgi:hypothetical protein
MTNFEAYQLSIINQNWGDEPTDFSIQVHCEVKETGKPGGEAFLVNLISPNSLNTELFDEEFRSKFGRGYLIINDYDEVKILLTLQKLIEGSCASNWNELISYVEKYFDWID